MYLLVDFLVLCVIIPYYIMIPLSPLSLLIVMSHQIFANVVCIILVMISLSGLSHFIIQFYSLKAILNHGVVVIKDFCRSQTHSVPCSLSNTLLRSRGR
jgi:hypothetical protein